MKKIILLSTLFLTTCITWSNEYTNEDHSSGILPAESTYNVEAFKSNAALLWTATDTETKYVCAYSTGSFDIATESNSETLEDAAELGESRLNTNSDFNVKAVSSLGNETTWIESVTSETVAPCLLGDKYFSSQAQIDDFGTTYSYCTDIALRNVIIQGTNITNLDGLANVTSITGNLLIQNNSQLTNIDGLVSVISISGYLTIENNTELTNLDGLENLSSISRNLFIVNNSQLMIVRFS